MSDLGLELGKWLFEKRPRLLVFGEDDVAEALDATAAALGGLLSAVLVRSGEDVYDKMIRIAFVKADNAARKTATLAVKNRQCESIKKHQ